MNIHYTNTMYIVDQNFHFLASTLVCLLYHLRSCIFCKLYIIVLQCQRNFADPRFIVYVKIKQC